MSSNCAVVMPPTTSQPGRWRYHPISLDILAGFDDKDDEYFGAGTSVQATASPGPSRITVGVIGSSSKNPFRELPLEPNTSTRCEPMSKSRQRAALIDDKPDSERARPQRPSSPRVSIDHDENLLRSFQSRAYPPPSARLFAPFSEFDVADNFANYEEDLIVLDDDEEAPNLAHAYNRNRSTTVAPADLLGDSAPEDLRSDNLFY